MKTCALCGFVTKNTRLLALHYARSERKNFKTDIEFIRACIKNMHEITDNKLDELIRRYDEGESKYEIALETGINLSRILVCLGKLRSAKEAHKTDRYKNRIKTTIKNKYGVEYISQCSEIKEKKKNTYLQRYGVIHNFLIPETKLARESSLAIYLADKEKLQKAWKKCIDTLNIKYGENVINFSQLSFVKSKISNKHKKLNSCKTIEQKREMTKYCRQCLHEQYLQSTDQEREILWKKRIAAVRKRNRYISSLEVRICNILTNLEIKYNTQVFINKMNYDICINDIIIIEVQGDYWHANPLIYEETDLMFSGILAKTLWEKDEKKKLNILNHNKYFYEIWESDIRKMTDKDIECWIFMILDEVTTKELLKCKGELQ